MKLTKENIYIDLRGKSKEELNLITEITGVENLKNYYYLHFNTPFNKWIRYHVWTYNTENKTKVTIEQLKEILQPMENKEEQLRKEAIERGFVNGVEFFGSQGVESDKPMLICDNICYAKPNEDIGIWGLYVNNSWLCYNGTWGTLAEETLEQQLEKAEAEVKRLREAIEEENEIKVGDLVKCSNKNSNAKCVIGIVEDLHPGFIGVGGHWYDKFEKITDSVLSESLNKMF